jgi:hypothetical protein
MRTVWVMALLLSVAGSATAQKARSLSVAGKTLQVSKGFGNQVDALKNSAEWKQRFPSWSEAVRYRRLGDGSVSDETLHWGKKATPQGGGQMWLVRLTQTLADPPPASAKGRGGGLTIIRTGRHQGNRVFGATQLPNGHTLEVTATLDLNKKHGRFALVGSKEGWQAPTGKFIVRDGAGREIQRGDVRALWRKATSTSKAAKSWATSNLGLSPEKLKEMLVDLTG